ncbi:MAG: hypothetical protein K0S93_782 [Nitrososphaeraceae archaeon]|jgi:hypothetical protein|nr:hypothetical protein [Nitrososphaeraceae archaeon]
MLSKENKIKNYEDFIKSDKFGIDSWKTLLMFKTNSTHILTTLTLYEILIKRLNEGKIDFTADSMTKTIINQFIYLDVISKLEILIESSLVLIHALSHNYNQVASLMLYYDTNLINTAINKITNQRYNLKRVFGLPNISRLSILSKEERKYLVNEYDVMEKVLYSRLLYLIKFYNKFRLIYGKYKHGLTIVPGLNSFPSSNALPINPEYKFENSMLVGYDRKREIDLPSSYIKVTEEVDENKWEYFNTLTCVRFNSELTNEISTTISYLKALIPYLADNHLAYAKNCGEDYLPYYYQDNTTFGLLFSNKDNLNEDDVLYRNEITKKIIPLMNMTDIGLYVINEFKDKDVIKSIQSNSVTNIWKPIVS